MPNAVQRNVHTIAHTGPERALPIGAVERRFPVAAATARTAKTAYGSSAMKSGARDACVQKARGAIGATAYAGRGDDDDDDDSSSKGRAIMRKLLGASGMFTPYLDACVCV